MRRFVCSRLFLSDITVLKLPSSTLAAIFRCRSYAFGRDLAPLPRWSLAAALLWPPDEQRADLLPHYLSIRRSPILSLQQQPSLSLGPSAPVLGACSASLERSLVCWPRNEGRLGLSFQSLCPLSTADAPGHPVHPQHCCSDLDFVGIVAVEGLFVHSMSESSC